LSLLLSRRLCWWCKHRPSCPYLWPC